MSNVGARLKTTKAMIGEARHMLDTLYRGEVISGPPFPDYTLTPAAQDVLESLHALAWEDVHRYVPEKESEGSLAGETPEIRVDAPGDKMVPTPDATSSAYTATFAQAYTLPTLDSYQPEDLKDPSVLARLSKAEGRLFLLTAKEIGFISTHLAVLGFSISTLNKGKKALEALANRRINDAITMLKSARDDDPNNRPISFILSQVLYFRAFHGHGQSLPEAREEAKRCCVFSEKFDDNKLMYYRYSTVAVEMHFSPTHALDLMRDYYLINPDTLVGPEGLNAHEGIHLKSLLLLAHLPLEAWSEFECDSLVDVTRKTVAGVLIYLHFFRKHLLTPMTQEPDEYTKFIALEQDIFEAFQAYQSISDAAATIDASPQQVPYPWTVTNRYTNLLLKAAPLPTFDEVLMHTSLNGRRYESGAYPTDSMRRVGLTGCDYWSAWMAAITPESNFSNPHHIPLAQARTEAPVLHEFTQLLEELKEAERAEIDAEKWQMGQPYLPHYSYTNLIDVGANISHFKRDALDSYFAPYHRAWAGAALASDLPSAIIQKQAQNGGFASLGEIQAVFEGAYAIIQDPVHGLKARQKLALKRLLKKKKDGRLALGTSDGFSMDHFKEFWWFYLVLLPLSGITFMAVSTSNSYMEALQTFVILVALFAVCGMGVLFVLNSAKRASKIEPENLSDDEIVTSIKSMEDDTSS